MSEHDELMPPTIVAKEDPEPTIVEMANTIVQETTDLLVEEKKEVDEVKITLHDEFKANLVDLETSMGEAIVDQPDIFVTGDAVQMLNLKNAADEVLVDEEEDIMISVDDVKTLASVLQLVLTQTDDLDKYSVSITPEIQSIFTKLMEEDNYFNDVEQAMKDIIQDDKIDAKDVPRIMVLFSDLYVKLRTMKVKFDEKMCGDIIKFVFDVALKDGIIQINKADIELFNSLYGIVDMSTSLMQTRKGGKRGGILGCILRAMGMRK